MEEKKILSTHSLMLENRQNGRITGVKDIKSFDEKEILLFTQAGKLVIKGEQLHVKQLDLEKGEVDRVVMKGETLTVTLKKQQKMGTPATLYTTLMEDASELVKRL